jgi:hypothetical protein
MNDRDFTQQSRYLKNDHLFNSNSNETHEHDNV